MDIWHVVAILIGGYFLRKIYSLFKGYKREIKNEKFNHLDQKKIEKKLRKKDQRK